MKKINTISKFSVRAILSLAISAALLSSCSSEYHWVKVKSANPHFAAKSDNYATTVPQPAPAVVVQPTEDSNVQPSSSLATSETNSNSGLATATGNDQLALAQQKAEEIKSTLSPARENELNSDDNAVRKQAIRKTLDEQLSKNETFNKIPEAKKNLVEKILVNKTASMTAKISKAHAARNIGGLNTLLIVGLILLVLGVILDFVSPIAGVIFTVVGAVLAVIGLVQMLT